MEDDIDDLLDEVESKFCCDDSAAVKKTQIKHKKTVTKPVGRSSFSEDLDDMINDIIADDGLDAILNNNSGNNTPNRTNPTKAKEGVKCFTIYVGGALSPCGATTSNHHRSCDELHCTSCDHKIVSFNDFTWSESDCDYLVFRNNYPDFSRLKSKLVPRKGYRSYCCQCCWVAVKDLIDLKTVKPSFKWICKKHKD